MSDTPTSEGTGPETSDDHSVQDTSDAVHRYFGLTYSSYLVLRRSVLQSMPDQWQELFVTLIRQIPETLELPDDMADDFVVLLRKADGTFDTDPYRDYQRGRFQFPPKQQE